MTYELQDPDETLTWSVNWADWLDLAISPTDTISSSSWSITPSSDVTLTDRGASGNVASVRVSGLTRGVLYLLTSQITSADGDTGERSIVIRCEKR